MMFAPIAAIAAVSAFYQLQKDRNEEEAIRKLPQEMQSYAWHNLKERRAERERKATEERRHREMLEAIDRVNTTLRYRRIDY